MKKETITVSELLKKAEAAGYGAYTMVGAGRRGNVLEGNFSVSWTGANYLV